jgi:hypothetical protein
MIQSILLALLLLQRGVPASGDGIVSGRLTYSDGAPAFSQAVQLAPQPGQTPAPVLRTVRTDATGAFLFFGLVPGRYTIRFESGGASIYYPGVLAEAGATVVAVDSGSSVGNLEFRLPPSADGVRILGRVAFPSNYVLPPTPPVVQVRNVAFPQGIPIAPDGTFEIPHVRPGIYSLLVAPALGMQPVTVTVANRDVENVQMIVPRLIDVVGTVTADDRSRPNFSIGLINPALPATPTPIANGAFTTRLPAGEYRITAQGLPTGYYFKSITAGSSNLIGSPLKIDGTDPVRIAIALGNSTGVRVRGRVKDSSEERRLTLVDPVQLTSVEGTTAADGTFEFERVMPGTYLARLTLTSSIGSPFRSLTIPPRDVSDLEIVSPALKEISGRVAVDGDGSLPRFSLLLVRGTESLLVSGAAPSDLPTVTTAAANVRAGIADTQILQIDVDALPDGTFKIKIPEGTYRVAAVPNNRGIPPAYVLKSLTYGSARLLSESLTVSADDTDQLYIGFGTTAPNPWLKVSGRVVGATLGLGPNKVSLRGDFTSMVEAFVDGDGKFEFPRVLPGSNYTVSVLPANDAVPAPRINVADKDVTNVQIVVPAEREVTIRTSMEGGGPLPVFQMSLGIPISPTSQGAVGTFRLLVKPESDGTFKTKLPNDERRVQLAGLPLGYRTTTMTYGSTDLRQQPLKISDSATSEIQITFAIDPAVPMGSVRGRVRGLDPNAGSVRLILNGAASFSNFEAPVGADGSFNFPKIPQGSYVPSLSGGVTASRLTPAIVTVTGTDLFGIEIQMPQSAANRSSPPLEEGPTGARVSDMNGGARETANENATVTNLRTINTALVTYLSTNRGNYGSMADLVGAGLLDPRFTNGPISGFHYTVIATGSNYAAVAIPTGQETGRYGYFAVPDAVIRYSTFEGLAPPRQSGNPVQ